MNHAIVYSNQWNDQIFEGRNKQYGAYVLRKQADDNTLKGLLIALMIISSAVAIPLIVSEIYSKLNPSIQSTSTPVVLTDLKPDEIIKQPKIEQPKQAMRTASTFSMLMKPIITNDGDANDDKAKGDLQNQNDISAIGDSTDTGDVGDLLGGGGGNPIPDDTAIYSSAGIEQLPEFPGGENALLQFIGTHTTYPRDMIDNNIDGTVYMSFVVNKEGKIDNVSVMRGISASKKFEKEAARVISSMPEWKPGKQNGHTVNVQFVLPIRFALK